MKYQLLSILTISTILLGVKTTAQAETTIDRSNHQIAAAQIANSQPRSSTDAITNIKLRRIAIDAQSSSTMTIESLELSIYNQIARYRQSHNLPPLTIDLNFAARARAHSEEMAKTGKLTHINDSVAHRRAYPTAAENIASNRDYPNPDLLAVQDWIASPAHQQHILGNYNLTGIGVAKNDQGEYYFTQIFIRKSE